MESASLGRSVLIVDDDPLVRNALARHFRHRGHFVRTAGGVDEALGLVRAEAPEAAVIDLRMGDGSGIDLVRELSEIAPATRTVILTAYGSIASAVEAMQLGAVNYLPKPADPEAILAAIDRDLQSADEHQAATLARAEWEHIQRVLADAGGNISEAARRLGIHRRSLQRKLQKFAPGGS
ncbi:MAG TPA: response regulator [Polyangia bacterium]|jgi:two-component system response regulator RegA